MGDAGYTLNNLFHTYDPATKMGGTNRSAWSDPLLDHDIDAALTEHDPARRLAFLRAADQRALDAHVLLPSSPPQSSSPPNPPSGTTPAKAAARR